MRRTDSLVRPGDFAFLTSVYKRECDHVQHSPELAAKRNQERANRVASKLLAALNIYGRKKGDKPGSTNFPSLELEDPCRNMASLPLQLRPSENSWHSKKVFVRYAPAAPKTLSDRQFGFTLGSLTVHEPYSLASTSRPASISEVTLHRPWADGRGPTLSEYPQRIEGKFEDGYLVSAEAMNFIGLVDQYLEKLGQARLILVGSSRGGQA